MQSEQQVSSNERMQGLLRVAAAGLIWGSIPLFTRAVDTPSAVKVFFRVAIAGVVVAIWMLSSGEWRQLLVLPGRKWLQLVIQGLVLTLNWVLFLTALDMTNVATAELLGYTGPVFVAALAPWITREAFDRRVVLPLALALGGIIVILAPHGLAVSSRDELIGAGLAFASAITYATLLLRSKNILRGVSSRTLMLVEYTVASIVLAPFVVIAYSRGQGVSTPREYGALLTLGIVHTVIAGLLFFGGMRRVRTDHVAILTYVEPVSAVVFAALLLAEPLTATTVIGGLMVVGGGLVVARLGPATQIEAVPLEVAGTDEDVTSPGAYTEVTRAKGGGRMAALERIAEINAVSRLHERDTSLFSTDPVVAALVAGRLGWTTLAHDADATVAEAERLAAEARAEGVTDVVLLGMGGSSLASLVLATSLRSTGPKLHVLDTVSPITVTRTLAETDPARTLYLFASKSGGTIEPNSLYAIFRRAADEALGTEQAGRRFLALTDPGTALEERAAAEGFRGTVSTPSDVGGRFSALTAFGLVPAALIGADVGRLIERAVVAERACAEPAEENPAAALAAFMIDAHATGADKLTMVADEGLATFGLWVEQLVAESLGKNGGGIVPVVELGRDPEGYGRDRAVVVLRLASNASMAEWAQVQRENHPVFEIVLADEYDLAAEFVRWEHAVAICGALMGINPFDEPNVAEAKAATTGILDGSLTAPKAHQRVGGTALAFAGGLVEPEQSGASVAAAVSHALASVHPGDYFALLVYLPDDAELLAPLAGVVPAVSESTGAAVCLELGPRYLHSTGQLHKGGPDTGVFLLVTTRDEADVAVPGAPWGLKTLHRAQAEGDLVTLVEHGRRVLHVDLPDASAESVHTLAEALALAAGGLATPS